MKKNIPLFLRLALVVILATSFSLVPMAVQLKPAQAVAVADLPKDILIEVSTSVNQATTGLNPGLGVDISVQRALAGPGRAQPFLQANVGDTITIKAARGTTLTAASQNGLTTTVATGSAAAGVALQGDGRRNLTFVDAYPVAAPAVGWTAPCPNAVLAGVVFASCGDFPPGASLSTTVDAAPVTTIPASPTVGSGVAGDAGAGRFFPISFKLPAMKRSTTASPHVVKFSDGTTDYIINLLVNPKAQFTPDHASKGKTITVTGTGFRSNSSIDVEVRPGVGITAVGATIAGAPLTLAFPFDTDASVSSTVQVTILGTFTVTVPPGLEAVIPTGTAGVTGPGATVCPCTVRGVIAGEAAPVAPRFASPALMTAAAAGTTAIDVSAPAAAGALPAIIQPSLKVSTGLVTTDANGSFTATFAAPDLMAGATPTNMMLARDGGNATTRATDLNRDLFVFTMDPSVTVTPSSAAAGGTVTVRGTEFPPLGAAGALTMGGVLAAVPAGTAADANGLVADFQTVVPRSLSAGAKSVSFTVGGVGGVGAVTVTGTPLSLSPASGPRGREVVITVRNMPPLFGLVANTIAAVTIGGAAATAKAGQSLAVDSTGNAAVTFIVPAGAALGADDVIVTMADGAVGNGTYTNAKPTITLNPSTASRTSTVTVVGKGWVPDKSVNIAVGPGAAPVTTFSATPDGAGAFTANFTVSTDLAANSDNNVAANDGAQGNVADTVVLHVPEAAVTLTPTAAKWGDTITIKGSGFVGGSTMRYGLPWLGAVAAASFPTPVYTDSAGNFTATLVVPSVTKGTRSLGVTDGANSATTTLDVSEAPRSLITTLGGLIAAKSLVRVWSFDGTKWKLFDPAVPAELNTLSALNPGDGFFINVTAASTIVNSAGVTLNLSPGWQLKGW